MKPTLLDYFLATVFMTFLGSILAIVYIYSKGW